MAANHSGTEHFSAATTAVELRGRTLVALTAAKRHIDAAEQPYLIKEIDDLIGLYK